MANLIAIAAFTLVVASTLMNSLTLSGNSMQAEDQQRDSLKSESEYDNFDSEDLNDSEAKIDEMSQYSTRSRVDDEDPLCPVTYIPYKCGETNPNGKRSNPMSGRPLSAMSGRIANGQVALPGEFPYIASVSFNGSLYCGGVVIDRWHILTAAHCTTICQDSGKITITKEPADFRIRLGNYLTKTWKDCHHTYHVEEIWVKEEFDLCKSTFIYDVAVLRLTEKIDLGFTDSGYGSVGRVCMPKKGANNYNGTAIVSGWGWYKHNTSSDVLRFVDVPIVDLSFCKEEYSASNDNIICACGQKGSQKQAWFGDSGGPLIKEENGRHHLIGLVASGWEGKDKKLRCFFTKVSKFIDWIYNITDSKLNAKPRSLRLH